MTDDLAPPTATEPRPWQLTGLVALVGGQGAVMLAYVVLDVVLAATDEGANWGAVAFVVSMLGLWGVGLLVCARGLVRHRRWAFTPVVFTQLMFGLLAVEFLPLAAGPAKAVWGVVLVSGVVVLALAFSRPVRAVVQSSR